MWARPKARGQGGLIRAGTELPVAVLLQKEWKLSYLLEALAGLLEIDSATLKENVDRFNEFATAGKDLFNEEYPDLARESGCTVTWTALLAGLALGKGDHEEQLAKSEALVAKGHRVSHLFAWYEIVMHNANVALLGISLLVNDMEVEMSFMAFPAVFGIAYVAWAAIYANFISGVFIYDFMDYRKRGAPLIYLALLSLQTLFFFVVMALDRIADRNLVLAALIVSVMTWQISKIKDPSQG